MIPAQDVARKYAGARPGFELIHFAEVGIPFYRLQLDALVQRRKPVGPIDEFVLRSVDAGLDSLDDVCGLLGVDRVLVERSVVDLSRHDQLDYRVDGDRRVLRMTEQGRRALEGWRELMPNREECCPTRSRELIVVHPKVTTDRYGRGHAQDPSIFIAEAGLECRRPVPVISARLL